MEMEPRYRLQKIDGHITHGAKNYHNKSKPNNKVKFTGKLFNEMCHFIIPQLRCKYEGGFQGLRI